MQYAGLGLYVVAEAVIFVPILLIAQQLGRAQGENMIASAGVMTAVIFGGLTAVVFLDAQPTSRGWDDTCGWQVSPPSD